MIYYHGLNGSNIIYEADEIIGYYEIYFKQKRILKAKPVKS